MNETHTHIYYTLAAYNDNGKVSVWCPSVCLFHLTLTRQEAAHVYLSHHGMRHIFKTTHQGPHVTWQAYVPAMGTRTENSCLEGYQDSGSMPIFLIQINF